MVQRLREAWYWARFWRGLNGLQGQRRGLMPPADVIDAGATPQDLWRALQQETPAAGFRQLSLAADPDGLGGNSYWQAFRTHYASVGWGREKALEHSLTFQVFDMQRVRRFCDVAAATSLVEVAFRQWLPGVEYWKQDFLYQTDLPHRVIGGLAQKMSDLPAGFFDAMALHCSFEHFTGSADTEFVAELDRIISPGGACLILPLYIAETHRIYFDPTALSPAVIQGYDSEAQLYPLYRFGQEHGRYYSPKTLDSRILSKLPAGLRATLLHFTGQETVSPDIYLRFGLVLHRATSIFRWPS
jgi:hypothetical protein